MSTQEQDLTLAETIEIWEGIGGEDQLVVWLKELQRHRQQRCQNDELLEALNDALAWIDAVPSETELPTMPGFDRDEVNNLIARVKGGAV